VAYIITILLYLLFLFVFGLRYAKRLKKKEDFLVAGRSLTAPVLRVDRDHHRLLHRRPCQALRAVHGAGYSGGPLQQMGTRPGHHHHDHRLRHDRELSVPGRGLGTQHHHRRQDQRQAGWVLNIITEGKISDKQGIIIVAVFVVTYTMLAGMLSVAHLDMFNGILMITAFFVAVPFLIQHVGGLEYVAANVTPRAHSFLGNMSWVQALGYFFPTLLLALGNGNMYQRFFSAKNEGEARKSVIGWIIGVIFLGIAIQSIAVIGSSYFKGLSETESGRIIVLAAYQGLPVVIGCALLAAIVAIIISTANSFLLVPATNVVRDIYQRFINPDLSDKKMILLSRIVVVFLGGIAFVLIFFFKRILDAAYAAYTIYGAGITPALMAVFFWKRATAKGGVSSILGGLVTTIAWEVANRIQGGLPFGVPAVYPALIVSVGLLIFVSLATPKPDPEKWKPFFKEQN
jgi:SSS family solute:Na+ symporter/sodium/proline symporter